MSIVFDQATLEDVDELSVGALKDIYNYNLKVDLVKSIDGDDFVKYHTSSEVANRADKILKENKYKTEIQLFREERP